MHSDSPQPAWAVLTAGGDCPGLNAALHAIAVAAMNAGRTVLGVERGYAGLLENRFIPLSPQATEPHAARGGSLLGCDNRCDPGRWRDPASPDAPPRDRVGEALTTLAQRGVGAMIVLGGEGSLGVAARFTLRGFPVVGIPKSIDNDIVACDASLGFASARQFACDAIDRLRDTGGAHRRAMFIELMGRRTGWLTLHAGLAAGADAVLMPERAWSLDGLARAIGARAGGPRGAVVCIAEGSPLGDRPPEQRRIAGTDGDPVRFGGVGERLASMMQDRLSVECRSCAPGHLVRGGAPIAADRELAQRLAVVAVELLLQDRHGRVVLPRGGAIVDGDILQIGARVNPVPQEHPLWAVANSLGIYTGD